MRCPECHAPLMETDAGLYCGYCYWTNIDGPDQIPHEEPKPKLRRWPRLIRKIKKKEEERTYA